VKDKGRTSVVADPAGEYLYRLAVLARVQGGRSLFKILSSALIMLSLQEYGRLQHASLQVLNSRHTYMILTREKTSLEPLVAGTVRYPGGKICPLQTAKTGVYQK